jgi:hypothetical protein
VFAYLQVVGDRPSIKEYLRAVTAAMALVEPADPDLTKTWAPIAAEVRRPGAGCCA